MVMNCTNVIKDQYLPCQVNGRLDTNSEPRNSIALKEGEVSQHAEALWPSFYRNPFPPINSRINLYIQERPQILTVLHLVSPFNGFG